jgi:phosphatidylserine decarboxylase
MVAGLDISLEIEQIGPRFQEEAIVRQERVHSRFFRTAYVWEDTETTGGKAALRWPVSHVSTPVSGAVAGTSRTRSDDPSPILAREGWPILAIVVVIGALPVVAVVLLAPAWTWAAAIPGILLLAFCCWFFRDPQRAIPDETGLLVAPADGLVIAIEPAKPPEELGLGDVGEMERVVIFLNVFNVHVNRVPYAGTIVKVAGKAGKFAHAGKPDAEHNQRKSIALKLSNGATAVVTQVTGLIARRIVCHAQEGASYKVGQRYGLIRFGSRTDVYLPKGVTWLVKPGDKTTGGVTKLAKFN